jgi:hypothetical protein
MKMITYYDTKKDELWNIEKIFIEYLDCGWKILVEKYL